MINNDRSLLATAAAYALFAHGEGRAALLAAMPVLGFGYGCLWSLQLRHIIDILIRIIQKLLLLY